MMFISLVGLDVFRLQDMQPIEKLSVLGGFCFLRRRYQKSGASAPPFMVQLSFLSDLRARITSRLMACSTQCSIAGVPQSSKPAASSARASAARFVT